MPSTAEKKRIVAGFLVRCNGYAAERIAFYRSQLDTVDTAGALALQDKIGHWTAYKSFNEYTLTELTGDELNDWFND